MEIVVVPNIDVVKRGVLIGSAVKLGSESSGVSAWRNLSQSLVLLAAITRVVGIPQMVFTNLIMATHGNRITAWPLMSSMVARGCKSAMHSRGGYWKLIVVIVPIFDHRDGHYVRPNRVAFKYLDFKKDVDPNAHVRMFNFAVKTNVETSKKYIINVFSYTLKDTT